MITAIVVIFVVAIMGFVYYRNAVVACGIPGGTKSETLNTVFPQRS